MSETFFFFYDRLTFLHVSPNLSKKASDAVIGRLLFIFFLMNNDVLVVILVTRIFIVVIDI